MKTGVIMGETNLAPTEFKSERHLSGNQII